MRKIRRWSDGDQIRTIARDNIDLPTVTHLDGSMATADSLDFSWGWNDTPLLPLASEYVQNPISEHPMILRLLRRYFAILRPTSRTRTNIAERPGLIAFYISICSSDRFDFISLSLNMFHSKLLLYIFIPPFLLSPP